MPDTINPAALEPLFAPWDEPNAHRIRGEKRTNAARVVKGRRPSSITIAQNLRRDVREWRELGYVNGCETTRHLLGHWFDRTHRRSNLAGEEYDFRYYFCQREAIETFIYLKEIRGIQRLSQLIADFGGESAEIAALGVTEEEDLWSRYAFKLATGAGKTKVMSLAIVWSYFHALRESDSPMARHFLVIAPNLTVYERLKDDFKPGDGRQDVFTMDPLVPMEWRGDWNLSVVLQDDAGGVATRGVLYLTNIHRLYDPERRKGTGSSVTYGWMGPSVSKDGAFDTAAALRDRIGSHKRLLVLNDEAHHVWDPNSAWNEAIQSLQKLLQQRGGDGIVAQLDFSATPKDNKGQVFKHVVCDTPLGEAVDGGIVKTPIIGRTDVQLEESPDQNAAYRFEKHLLLGYERWRKSFAEWKKSGKKALLFVMCEDTAAADQITHRLDTDPIFRELNGATINLHTNLKGRVKKVGSGATVRYEFVENEKDISDDDLRQLRKLSRELDENSSPYRCIVSVLMLREGWDVRNVTTIVPLRPYSSQANILPEQTLGRGLRRITAPMQATETVTVVEHPAFASLYEQELAQEGLPIEIVDVEKVPVTTVSIYPDEGKKNVQELELAVPRLTAGHAIKAELKGLTLDQVKREFQTKGYHQLPLGKHGTTEINYEGRHLFSGEVVERSKVNLPLLASGVGAVSFYVKQLETICKLRGTHSVLAPVVQTFLEEILFQKKSSLFDEALVSRLGDPDVGEHVRAVFVPLIRQRTITSEGRVLSAGPMNLSGWRPFQVTHSESHPVLKAKRTLFNLVPCNRELEVAFVNFADKASDVVAFAKNAGPQSLRIDYLQAGGQLAFYTPDFFLRARDGGMFLVETKGREDRDVPRKAAAAVQWCKSASKSSSKWEYIYVPQGVFEEFRGTKMDMLVSTCRPALQNLINSGDDGGQRSIFDLINAADEKWADTSGLAPESVLAGLPPRYRKAVEQASMLFRIIANKEGMNLGAAFSPLLPSFDEAARGLIVRRLQVHMPATMPSQRVWFEPEIPAGVTDRGRIDYQRMAQNLKKTLVFNNGISPIGLLRSCMDFALNDTTRIGGVFEAVRAGFQVKGGRELLGMVVSVNNFRNTRVAHQDEELHDAAVAERELKAWIKALHALSTAS